MADQKKWFKVWASILNDDQFNNTDLVNIGRWCRLGALICQQGENGKMRVVPPAKIMLAWFEVDSITALKSALSVLPNVSVECSAGGTLDDNGSFFVIMKNWRKYQVDSTIYERIKRLRRKRREDKIRKEESENGLSSGESKPLAGPYGG